MPTSPRPRNPARAAAAVEAVPAAYAPECLSTCELAFHCRERARRGGEVVALGRSVRGELGGLGTVAEVLAAASGDPADTAPDPAAALLRRAAALRAEALSAAQSAGTSEACGGGATAAGPGGGGTPARRTADGGALMSLLSALARMEAAASGHAQPVATVRHRHLAERPLVLVPLTTAGENGAPLGVMLGTERAAPEVFTVAQPRDRDLRFAFLGRLAEAMLPHLESCQDEVELVERKEADPETGKRVTVEAELCADAPQVLVPTGPGVEFVRLLGRSMRFRRTAEEDPEAEHPAPPRVPLLGRWLTHYGERARVPGSSLLLSMTGLLSRHWATGQSQLEDQHLGALLAWLAPPDGLGGAEAALRAELGRDGRGQLLVPPAGPATDPAFDNELLAPALARHDRGVPGAAQEVHDLVAGQLRPTWEAMWQGVDLLRTLPAAAQLADRWRRDRLSYTHHRDRVRAGEPPQPRRDDAVTAAPASSPCASSGRRSWTRRRRWTIRW